MSRPLIPFLTTFQISFTLNLSTPMSLTNATATFRKYQKFDKEKLKADILASELLNNPSKEADTLYEQYHTTLFTLIDNGNCGKRDQAFEHIWRRNKSTFKRSQYMQKVHHYNKICRPNLNSLKQNFRTITTTHKNYGKSWVMCYTESQQSSSHRILLV